MAVELDRGELIPHEQIIQQQLSQALARVIDELDPLLTEALA